MPKKNMTPEERKAWGEKMKAARAAKQTEHVEEVVQNETQDGVSEDAYQALLKRVQELESSQSVPKAQGPQIREGSLVGTVEKYIVDPAYYPNPVERLIQESRLAQFAFPLNFELGWNVGLSQYQTIDGIRQKEPKFVLELRAIVRDEEGNPTDKRYTLRKITLHEDPQAAIIVARDNGLEVDESNEREFLNEMRYLRMRDWLFEYFYPPKLTGQKKNRQETVIGNRLVEVYEMSSDDAVGFGNITQ